MATNADLLIAELMRFRMIGSVELDDTFWRKSGVKAEPAFALVVRAAHSADFLTMSRSKEFDEMVSAMSVEDRRDVIADDVARLIDEFVLQRGFALRDQGVLIESGTFRNGQFTPDSPI